MTNPWLITVLGMGTVFLALIVLSLVLQLFPILFRTGTARVPASPPKPAPAPVRTPAPAPAAPPGVDGALVAVIAAAVAAARGDGAGPFRIASIGGDNVHGSFNTPAWGYIDRLVRNFGSKE